MGLAPYYKVFTGKTCFPEPVTLQGTVSTVGTKATVVDGDGKLYADRYLYNAGTNEVRKIIRYDGDNPILESAFSVDIEVGISIQLTDDSRIYTSISVANIGAADGLLKGQLLTTDMDVAYKDSDGLSPITIDGTGTSIAISAL